MGTGRIFSWVAALHPSGWELLLNGNRAAPGHLYTLQPPTGHPPQAAYLTLPTYRILEFLRRTGGSNQTCSQQNPKQTKAITSHAFIDYSGAKKSYIYLAFLATIWGGRYTKITVRYNWPPVASWEALDLIKRNKILHVA